MMASPTLKEEKAKRQQQLHVEPVAPPVAPVVTTAAVVTSAPTMPAVIMTHSPSKLAISTVATPLTTATSAATVTAVTTTRIRRVTGNRTPKPEEPEKHQETEEKIKAILEHASKQQEIEQQHHQQQMGLLREVNAPHVTPQVPPHVTPQVPPHVPQHPPVQQKQPALSVYPAPAPPVVPQVQMLPRPGLVASKVVVTAAASPALVRPVQPQTTVVSVQKPTVVPQPQQPQQPMRPQIPPPQVNSPGLSVVQLPTQPLPASEIARTSKQVLLEPKVAAAPSPKISIPSTSPRAPASISLPTQPVPMSAAQLTSVANAIVARTMTSGAVNPAMMLPNQPLPPQIMTLPPQQAQTQQPPKLPQHPLPPTSTTTISVVTTRVATPPVPAAPAVILSKTQHVAPKKRVIAQATIEDDQFVKKEPANEPALIVIKKESTPQHMKPRDAFGRGAHLNLIKDEKPAQPAPATSISKLLQPQQPASPSLASQEQQLSLIREQEMTIFFQALVKQGNPEHIALGLAQEMAQDRYKTALATAVAMSNQNSNDNHRPSSVPPNALFVDNFRPSPLPAHMSVDRVSQQQQQPGQGTPAMAHAHSRISTSYMHPADPYADRHVIMNLNPPASPEPEFPINTKMPNLDAHPMVWKGYLGLKNEFASVEFRYVSGCKSLADASLPHDPSAAVGVPNTGAPATLRIGQRMRLEAAHLSGVRTKMQQAAEHCVLLALPFGKDGQDMQAQSRQLRSHFITYLQLKGAAGIVNVPGDHNPGNEGGYVVHVFPSCDFANETMSSIAPDLLAKVAEMEHMVIIIVTVLDKTGNE